MHQNVWFVIFQRVSLMKRIVQYSARCWRYVSVRNDKCGWTLLEFAFELLNILTFHCFLRYFHMVFLHISFVIFRKWTKWDFFYLVSGLIWFWASFQQRSFSLAGDSSSPINHYPYLALPKGLNTRRMGLLLNISEFLASKQSFLQKHSITMASNIVRIFSWVVTLLWKRLRFYTFINVILCLHASA